MNRTVASIIAFAVGSEAIKVEANMDFNSWMTADFGDLINEEKFAQA